MWQWYQIDSLFQLWLKGKFSLCRKILKSGDFKFLQKFSSFFPIPLLPKNKKRNPIEENFHFFLPFPNFYFQGPSTFKTPVNLSSSENIFQSQKELVRRKRETKGGGEEVGN
jgi:hypothetical protein